MSAAIQWVMLIIVLFNAIATVVFSLCIIYLLDKLEKTLIECVKGIGGTFKEIGKNLPKCKR